MLAINQGVYISSISIGLEGRTRAAIDYHSGNKLIRSDVEQHLLQIALNLAGFEQSVVSPNP